MATTDDDADNDNFSFPTVDNIPSSSSTSSIGSPLFWQLSVASTSTDGKHQDSAAPSSHPVEKNQNYLKRTSCMDQEQPPWITSSTTNKVEHHDEEEKMDLLWEDFNQELYPVRSTAPSDYNYDVSGQMLKLGWVGLGAFNLSKSHTSTSASTNTSIAKPAGVLEIIKVLRRLFFLHNINFHHHSLNKPAKW